MTSSSYKKYEFTAFTEADLLQGSDSDEPVCINVLENTDPGVIADLDCGDGDNPDTGLDACDVRDTHGGDKPVELTFTLGDALTDEIISGQDDKKTSADLTGATDNDSTVYVVVSRDDDPSNRDTNNIYAAASVGLGGTIVASTANAGRDFGGQTFVHIFSEDGGSLLQTIEFHTSCSQPLVIGDQYGTVSLAGFGFEDGGTIVQYGTTDTGGDNGVVYEITGGDGFDPVNGTSPFFNVDPQTGEVTLAFDPDFENPLDDNGDNKYDVEVTAFFVDEHGVKTGEVCDVKTLEVCVEDDCIKILENTDPGVIADLDCGDGDNPDTGLDACDVRDTHGGDKPVELTFTLGDALTDEIISGQDDKKTSADLTGATDNDSTVYVVVSRDDDPSNRDTNNIYAAASVGLGGTIVASTANAGRDFGGQTFVHIFSEDGGSLLQTIEFHTSCSQPLVIGDQYGTVSLAGFGFEDGGTIVQYGTTDTGGDNGVVYEITGGDGFDPVNGTSPFFNVDPQTGEVTLAFDPDFENPLDDNGDNKYDVEVTAFFVDEHGVKTGEVCDVKTLEVCVEDDCIKILENTDPGVIADLDCGDGDNPDTGLDACDVRDTHGGDKPVELTFTLGDALTDEIISGQDDKKTSADLTGATDNDSTVYVVVSRDDDPSNRDTNNIYAAASVGLGGTIVASTANAGRDFGGQTFVHIFSEDGGSLLQTIEFHTSCSQPLVIGDQYGTVSLAGFGFEDGGTIVQYGTTDTGGDNGVVYEITGGDGFDPVNGTSPFFNVDPQTGEVTLAFDPDFENPLDDNGDNKYDVEVTAFFVDANGNKTGEVCDVKTLEVCVEDQDCIKILENTNPGVLADLDCEEKEENPDFGKEICAERDALKDQGIAAEKPNQLTLTLNDDLTSVINSAQEGNKLEIDTFNLVNPDGGGLYIRVSDSDKPGDTDTVFFEGDVDFGESFTAKASEAGDTKFGSETYIHIFSQDGGQLLQTINYHTSCSAPITIGDQLGLVSLEGVGLLNKDTGETIEFGGSAPRVVVYEITGGDGFDPVNGTSPFFNVDPQTGEVTLAFDPDFENPLDDNGDNNYFVEVTGFFVNADGSREVCEVKPIEICIEDRPDPTPDQGKICADELLTIDVLANDGDGLTVSMLAGQTITEGQTILIDGTASFDADGDGNPDGTFDFTGLEATLSGGEIIFDGEAAFEDINIGEEASLTLTYEVEDANGNMADSTIDLTFCGDANTVGDFCDSLPEDVIEFNLSYTFFGPKFDVEITDSQDERFDGITFDAAYCVDERLDFQLDVPLYAKLYCFDEVDTLPEINAISENVLQTSGVNGQKVYENLDLISWILNQDFESMDNGDGGNETYTDAEVQGAIWGLTNSTVKPDFFVVEDYGDGTSEGTIANAKEIYNMALANGENYVAGVGDVVGVFMLPTDANGNPVTNLQPFIIGVPFEQFDCLC